MFKFILFFGISVLLLKNCSAYINLADVTCGFTGARSARIIGGEEAQRAEFPWIVSLKRRGGHFCGATVLNKRWLLTAGHCTCSGTNEPLKPAFIRATAGEYDLTSQETPRAQDIGIELVIQHPQYRCGRSANDVALLKLSSDIFWSSSVAPACLPDPRGKHSSDFSGNLATVAGWGWLNEDNDKGGRADVLQKVDVNVLDNVICQEWYLSKGKKTKIQAGQMCAGEEQGGKDSCWADSGGPLMLSGGTNSMVIGVVSTGIGCGRPRLPGLYTRVSEYMDWIQQETQ